MSKELEGNVPLAPGWRLAQKVNIVELTSQLGQELQTSTREDLERRAQKFQEQRATEE